MTTCHELVPGSQRRGGPEVITPTQTHALLLVLDGETTIRGVARRLGISASAAHHVLLRLRRHGLVAWTPRFEGGARSAELRALVRPVR